MRLIKVVAGAMTALALAVGPGNARAEAAGGGGGVDWNLLKNPNYMGAFVRGYDQGLRMDAQRGAENQDRGAETSDAPNLHHEFRLAPAVEPRFEPRAEPRPDRWSEPAFRPPMARPSAVEGRRFGGGL